MQGQVLDFSFEKNGGVISGNDSKRYAFSTTQWREQDMPARGMQVDFDVNEQGLACDVYLVAVPKPAPRTAAAKPSRVARVAAQPKSPEEFNLWDYALSAVKDHYADFNGRARRQEYWGFQLFYFLIVLGLVILQSIMAGESDGLGNLLLLLLAVFQLGMLIPNLAVSIRRLHDIDKSGWWLLISLIPLVGGIWLIVLMCQDGTIGENQFGDDPKPEA